MQEISQARPTHGGNLIWAASLAGCSPSDILDFSASINPLGLPQSAIDAIQNHLGDLVHYPDPSYQHLRQTLAQAHRLSPDWILPGNGSAELLTWAGRQLAEQKAVCLLTPAFSDYLRALRAFDAAIVPCPLMRESAHSQPADWSDHESDHESDHRLEQIAALPTVLSTALSTALPTALPAESGLLLNNPHNPTGRLFQRDEIVPLLRQFALVVIDEAFMDFLLPDRQQSLIDCVADYPNLVVLRSLTKFYSLPGLRLGYAVAHPDRLRLWQQWRDPWSVNGLAEAVARAVLQDTAFQQQTWNWLEAARAQLMQGLAALPGLNPLPGAANYLLVRSERPVPQLQLQLLQHSRILIRDCLSFPELGDRFFRVAVRTIPENQRLLSGLFDILN